MASADVVPEVPTVGNTSQDSGGSGSHKSMLELLSITDAAVKALNKSTRSHGSSASHASGRSLDSDRSVKSTHSDKSGQSVTSHRSQNSQQSLRSQHSDRSRGDRIRQKLQQDVDEVSRDSGVASKTQTLSDHQQKKGAITQGVLPLDGSLHERSSDESTTASDVLIRSTLDKSERSILDTNGSISKYSKSSFGVENFNSSGPHKIKISKKHLREIKPFDDGQNPRSSSDSDGKVPSSLLGKSKSSKSNSNSSGSSDSKSTGSKSGSQKDSKIIGVSNGQTGAATKLSVNVIRNTNGAPSFPKGVDNILPTKETVTKLTQKAIPLDSLEMKPNPLPKQQVTEIVVERTCKANFAAVPQSDIHVSDTNSNAAGSKNGASSTEPLDQFRSTPKYFIERHTPQKSQTSKQQAEELVLIPERKNLLQDLEDSVEITTVHGKDSSSSSSQPDILTVPERIVTVSAKTSLSSSASTISDLGPQTFTPPTVTFHTAGKQLTRDVTGEPAVSSKSGQEPIAGPSHMAYEYGKSEGYREPALDNREEKYFDYKSVERSFMGEYTSDESRHIPPALPRDHFEREPEDKMEGQGTLPARFQRFSKASSHGLRQGAMVDGLDAPDKQKISDDVEIVQTRQSEKQKAREIFAKRQGGPVRRVVQPQIVSHKAKPSSLTEEFQEPQLGQSSNQVLTTAAAASAAVAATQPFLKAQYDMEAKMAEVLTKISEIQSGRVKAPEREADRVQALEKQLADSTEKRIEYMERLQEQQMAMQAKLLSMTRGNAVSRVHGSSRSPENVYKRQETSTPSAAHLNKAFSKTVVNKPASKSNYSDRLHKYAAVDADESNSPLDTPAPRSRAPKPTSYDTSDMEFKARQKAKSRSRSRSPAKKDLDPGILHQILASTGSPHRERVQPPLQTRAEENQQSKSTIRGGIE